MRHPAGRFFDHGKRPPPTGWRACVSPAFMKVRHRFTTASRPVRRPPENRDWH